MKILVNTRELSYQGGVVNYLKVLNLDNDKNIDYFIISKLENKFKRLFLLSRYIVFFFKIGKYDLVQLNPSFQQTSLKRDMLFAWIVRLRGKRMISFMHGWDDAYEEKVFHSKILNYLFINSLGKSNAFFVLGNLFKEKLIKLGVNENKSKFYLQTMIADDKYLNKNYIHIKKESYFEENKTWRFLFMSRIVKNKGLELAINVFEHVQNKYPNMNFEFFIAGDGDLLPEIKMYVKTNNISNIYFSGFVREEKKDELLKLCDITLFPSYGEGLPNTIMEGMLYGHPIITRAVGGIPQWVKQGENGYITNGTSINEFVKYIEDLVLEPKSCKTISIENHNIAMKYFLKEKVLERHYINYTEIYNKAYVR